MDKIGSRARQKHLTMRRALIACAIMTVCAVVILPSSSVAYDRRDRDEMCGRTANQIMDVADARIARFKAVLRLTPDQGKNWGAVQTALHDMAQRRADRMLKLREQRAAAMREAQRPDAKEGKAQDDKVPDDQDWTTIDDMRMQADTLSARADDLRKIADATAPLYDSLNSSQRRRFGDFVSHYFGDERENGCHR
ncbi:Spy/CpxP family protein refolding chaperone [Methylocystis sp. L43]|jgi:hypothetical protein|uniref:Spy/CpxP family protein refolding chaperone n=1 Tax=unclassified Methylocystis TaxID=2625913 RepID=UPI0032B21D35